MTNTGLYLSNLNKGGRVSARPKGLMLEARREGFLGRGQQAPSPPARESGEHCKLLSGVRGRAPENFEFSAFWDLKITSRQCKMMQTAFNIHTDTVHTFTIKF